jgi:23S rRNA (uridine2552-2'-O)-methyltransferase
MDICYGALDLAKLYLTEGGSFVAKIYSGSEDKELLTETKNLFAFSKLVKPKASRSESSEKYLVCTGYKQAPVK